MRLATILVAVGLLCMAVGLPLGLWERGEVYEHDIRAEQVHESETTDMTERVNWTQLGPDEQSAVLQSYQQQEVVTITTEEPLAAGDSALDFEEDHWTLVNADGVYFIVGTTGPQPVRTTTASNWVGYLLAVMGFALTAAGAVRGAREMNNGTL